jgi:uncharacterized membrane protein
MSPCSASMSDLPAGAPGRGRIGLLDAWRTLAILCMVVYHFLYDLAFFGRMRWETFYSPGLNALQLFTCCSFILLAGISSRFSHSNLRRGAVTLLCGFLVMAGAALVGAPILFGILQLLGVSMLIYGLAGRYLERWPALPAAAVCLALFFVSRFWTQNTLVTARWLFPFGFLYEGFYSADYFPLLPWLFLFLLGAFFGGTLKKHASLPWLQTKVPAFVSWPGRHSLVIYMVHQPIIYGLCMLMFRGL